MKPVDRSIGSGCVKGKCSQGWEGVVDAFVDNYSDFNEKGASLCISVEGDLKVDVWGGAGSGPESHWLEDSTTVVFSATKGATALCAHILADRDEIALNDLVTRYWPEYGANGKSQTTIAMLLDHSAGVPGFREPLPDGSFADWAYMISRLEQESPWWEPGSQNGYHLINFGWTVGEIVRRVSGQSLGDFFAAEVAKPLELEFHIGLPEELESKVQDVEPYIPGEIWTFADPFPELVTSDPTAPASRAMLHNGGYTAIDPESGEFTPNSRKAHAAEIGGAGGVTNGRGLATMYAALVDGRGRLLSEDHVYRMSQTAMGSHKDPILQIPTRFASGFMKSMDNRDQFGPDYGSVLIGHSAFGHVGAGGSLGFADPECGLGFGYTMNRMGPGSLMNPRGQRLVDATYRKLGYRSADSGGWIR